MTEVDYRRAGFFREGLKSAKAQARAWLEENRPYALRNVVLPPR